MLGCPAASTMALPSSRLLLELTKSSPVWGLPSSTPPQIAVELYLRVCGLPYTEQLSPYPYSTATGREQPLPVVRLRHLVASPAPDCLSFVARRICDLDERRTAVDRAVISALTALLASLDELLECFLHSPSSPHSRALSLHASSLSLPHAVWLRWRRRSLAEAAMKERHLLTTAAVADAIRFVLATFETLLTHSRYPFVLSPRPSTIDVLLAANVAYMIRLPVDLRTPRVREAADAAPAVPEEQSLADLAHEHPLLWAHCALLFSVYFPAHSLSAPRSSSPPASPSASAPSSAILQEYHRRRATFERHKDGPSPSVPVYVAAATNGLRPEAKDADDADLYAEPPPPVQSAILSVAPLPLRIGDAWRAQMEATLTEEQRRMRAVRRMRMWMLGGAVAVAVFAVHQRSKARAQQSQEPTRSMRSTFEIR